MITFTKISFDSLPDVIRKAIQEIDDSAKTIIVDETKLTALQLTKLTEWLNQEGYK